MNNLNTYMLRKIWDTIKMLDTKASVEEASITPDLESLDRALDESLNEEQKELLHRYYDLLSELNIILEREAFIKGIKFATEYMIEAVDKL